MRFVTALTLVPGLLCLAAACGNSSTSVAEEDCPSVIPREGDFDVVVSGAGGAELCGNAVSFEGEGGGDWGLQLLSTSDISMVNIWTHGGGRPTPGTYAVVDLAATDGSPGSGMFVVQINPDPAIGLAGLTSVSGTLTILSSSSTTVTGTFEVSARAGTVGGADYTITGAFTAENTDS